MNVAYGLDDFIHEMTKNVEDNNGERLIDEAERLVSKLIRTTEWLPPDKRLSCATTYARHRLYEDPDDRFEVIALVWQPGQYTSLHDHDGTWGVEGVLAGRIKLTNYLRAGEESHNMVRLRRLGEVIVERESTGKLLPPADCHILEQQGDHEAITIHVYGKKLQKLKVFEPTDEPDVYVVRETHVGYTK